MNGIKIYECAKKHLSALSKNELENILILPKDAYTREEIELAYALAKKSFAEKKNIAKKFKFEFLLWLTGKNDINSALDQVSCNEEESCVVIVLGDIKIPNAKKPRLKRRADPLALERISLSRIKN
jgi:tRNA threonylcarbamoyladenosine modification (KEOPS) complex Cgi121 subunit